MNDWGVSCENKMKVLLSCGNNIGQPTGYGGQSLIIARHLRRAGHEVVCIAWSCVIKNSPMRGKMIPYMDFKNSQFMNRNAYISPEDESLFQTKTWCMVNPMEQWPTTVPKTVINDIICMTQADCFIAFQDIFVFADGPIIVPSLVWMPFHFKPLEQRVIRSLGCFDIQVAMSRYGEMLCNDYFGPCCPAAESSNKQAVKQIEYIPHGRPKEVFRPIPGVHSADLTERALAQESKAKLRRPLGWPEEAFVCLIVASNSEGSNRKALDAQLQAWSRFACLMEAKGRPCWLHVHSKMDGAMDMLRSLEMLGEITDRTRWTNPRDTCGKSRVHQKIDHRRVGARVSCSTNKALHRTSPEKMADMYRSADVLLACSCAEGFGVPIIESQLCGTPVLTNKSTAMTELTRIGYSVPPLQWLARNDFNAGWDVPNARGIVRALLRMSDWSPDLRAKIIRKHISAVRAEYDTFPVGEAWVQVIEDLLARREADGAVRGFPESRNVQLRAGRHILQLRMRSIRIRQEERVMQDQLTICDERSKTAEVFDVVAR